MIVDAGVHVWAAEDPARPWPPGRELPQREKPFGAEELLEVMDGHGVDRAVIVPPIWVGEVNTDVLSWASQYPERLAVMGRFALATEFLGELETWRSLPGMLGIRMSYPRAEFGDWLDLEKYEWFWAEVARCKLPLFVLCQNEAGRLAPIADRYPELPIVVDHLALRNIRLDRIAGRASDPFERFDDLLGLARFSNVSVKFSSLPTYSELDFPFSDLDQGLRRAVEAFGSDRIMWASDVTRMNLLERPPTYRQLLDHVQTELEFLTPEDRANILGGTAARILGWPASN